MVYHIHIQPSEIEKLPERRLVQLISATKSIRDEIKKQNERNGG